jgi:tRNA nucleotidyltransferase (CCA-adding enzyme)
MAVAAHVDVPADARHVLDTLWNNGHAAYAVGGAVRDSLLGRAPSEWDVATSALPEQTLSLFPGSEYTNRFGTVSVWLDAGDAARARSDAAGDTGDTRPPVEVTTFRRDHVYGDHRRPDSVTFTDSLNEDLARRDFTVNAMAWARDELVDPFHGMADLDARLIRAVGDPAARFDEDGLRLLRAARFAAQLGFDIEPRTLDAMRQTATTAAYVSAERVGAEVARMLEADPPSVAFRVLADTGVLEHAVPELHAQLGIPQGKINGVDLWGHSLASVDGAAQVDPTNRLLRLTALLHDIGKPPTFADGHFIGHDSVGAEMARTLLTRFAYERGTVEKVSALIAQHMFSYERKWSGAAVRRFIKRVGRDRVTDLINLRRADNIGSGLAPDAGHLTELEARIAKELEDGSPLTLSELAVRGDDLIAELGLVPGPEIGQLLERLLGTVIEDPSRNDRSVLLAQARQWMAAS